MIKGMVSDVSTAPTSPFKKRWALIVVIVVLLLGIGAFFGFRSYLTVFFEAVAFSGIHVAYVLPEDATRWDEFAVTEGMNPFDGVTHHSSAPGPIADIARSRAGTFVLVGTEGGGSALYEVTKNTYTLVHSFDTKKTELALHPSERLFAVAGDGVVSVVASDQEPIVAGEGRSPAFVGSQQNEDALAYLRGETVFARVHTGTEWGTEVPLYTAHTAFAPDARLVGGTGYIAFSNPNSMSAVTARVASIASPEVSFESGSTIPIVAPAMFVGEKLLGAITFPATEGTDSALLLLDGPFKQVTLALPKGAQAGVVRFITSRP